MLKRYWQDNKTGEKYGEHWCGQDIYILDDDYRDSVNLPSYIKIGRWMEDKSFHPILTEARDDEEIIEIII